MISSANMDLLKCSPKGIVKNIPFEGSNVTKENNDAKVSNKTKVLLMASLAALAAAGIYIATKGKVKTEAPAEPLKRILTNGKIVTKEVIKAEDGTQKIILKLFDKDGKFIYQKEKQITHSVNPANGKKYITKIDKYTSDTENELISVSNGEIQFVKDGVRVRNSYYDASGKKLFETESHDCDMMNGHRSKSKNRIGDERYSSTSFD